ncbi:MAG: iron-containing alcohol dehydrogenase [Brevinematales bacterium]|nr:iron-containing alcohol dehydrogenase [Brevinematales bacterium]
MEMNFSFQTNPKLYFGNGSLFELPFLLRDFGTNVLIITTNSFLNTDYYKKLYDELRREKIKISEYINNGEPSVDNVDMIVKEFAKENINVVVSIGGGSPIDLGKAVSAMLPLKESILSYLEGVGDKKHPGYKVPFIAIPTTAGTGAEATKNAVISKIGPSGFKRSLRHDNFMPDIAIVDPLLTKNCPLILSYSCGMDALTQLIESYTSTKANIYTDALCEKALSLFGKSFIKVIMNNATDEDYCNLSFAAYISGITLTNAGLGAVHGFASVLGGYYEIPHGIVCAKLLLPVVEKTISKLDNDSIYFKKYKKITELFSYEKKDLLAYLYEIKDMLKLPLLRDFGIKTEDFEKIARETSSKNNPVKLEKEDLIDILKKAD